MQRVGLIGLGNIGSHYTKKLREAGYPLTVLDLDPAKVERAVSLGARSAKTAGEVAETSDVILLSLPASPNVEAVMDGADGVLAQIKPGQLVIDTGTTRRETDIRYERLCREKGAGYLDAPITWRAPGLIIMAGGLAEDYATGHDVLACVSYKVQHVGPIGYGQILKMVNQLILAGQLAVWAESVEFAKAAGIDPHLAKDYLEFPVPDVLFGDEFAGNGTLALHYKDLGYILEAAHETGAHVSITNAVHEAFKAAAIHGDRNWGQPGIATYWRRLNEGRA